MAIVVDGSSPAVATGAGPVITTGAFTPPDNSVLLVGFSGDSTGNVAPPTPTITDNLGSHLAFTLIDHKTHNDQIIVNGQAAMWWAEVVTGASMTVSVTNTDASNTSGAVQVWVLAGADTFLPLGDHGKYGDGSTNSISQAYTAQATGGQGFLAVADWTAVGTQTAGTGCTMTSSGTVGSAISYAFARRTLDDDSNGSPNSLNTNLPGTSSNLCWVWAEVTPAGTSDVILEDPPPFVTMSPPGFGAPNGQPNAWWGSTDGGPQQPIVMTVTATEGGSTFNGIGLTVKVLTGAAATQNGAHNNKSGLTTPSLAITPNATGSWVYGAEFNATNSTVFTANGNTTYSLNNSDAVNGVVQASYRSTNTTTAATPVTLGATAPSVATGGLAQAEILVATTLVEDSSAPPSIVATGAITVTTASFSPPPGSLLVAMVAADSGSGVETMTVTGGSLIWTEVDKANATGQGYAGVWIAQVAGGGGPPPTNPDIVFQSMPRRRYVGLARRDRLVTPVPAQVSVAPPAYPPVGVLRRIKGALARRPEMAMVVPPQSTPAAPTTVIAPVHARVKAIASRRRITAVAPLEQAAPVQSGRPRLRLVPPRRRAVAVTPPAQSGVWQTARMRVKAALPRRRQPATVVPAQAVVTAPAYPPQSVRTRLKGTRLARGRVATVVPAQASVTPPTYVPQGLRARIRSVRLFRPRAAAPIPAQATPVVPYVPGRARQAILRQATARRAHAVSAPLAQAVPPVFVRLRLRITRWLRSRTRAVVPAQVVLIAPGYPPRPTRARRVLFANRRRRAPAAGWMVAADIGVGKLPPIAAATVAIAIVTQTGVAIVDQTEPIVPAQQTSRTVIVSQTRGGVQ